MPISLPTARLATLEANYQIGLALGRLFTDEEWGTTICREPLQRALEAIQDALAATEANTIEERRGLETAPPESGEERLTDPAPPMLEEVDVAS